MRSIATVAWIAGFTFVGLAMLVQGILPALAPETRTTRVTRAVRTELHAPKRGAAAVDVERRRLTAT